MYAVSVFKFYHAFENLANWGILSSKPNYCTGTNTLLIAFLLHLRQNVAITKDQIATKGSFEAKNMGAYFYTIQLRRFFRLDKKPCYVIFISWESIFMGRVLYLNFCCHKWPERPEYDVNDKSLFFWSHLTVLFGSPCMKE